MKWSNRIAQDFSPGLADTQNRPESTSNPADAGCNSQLAQYSNTPILHHSAWPDSRTRTRTKRLTSDDRRRCVSSNVTIRSICYTVDSIEPEYTCHGVRPPLSGRFDGLPHPGLKPWAILSNHFMVQDLSRRIRSTDRSNLILHRMNQLYYPPNKIRNDTNNIVNRNEGNQSSPAVSHSRDRYFLFHESRDRSSHGRIADERAYGEASVK